jgi:anti-anti-sigma factor
MSSVGDFRLFVMREPDRVVIRVVGELDVFTVRLLGERLDEVIGQGERRVTLDLTDTRSIDSAGLGFLVGTNTRLRDEGATLTVRGIRPPVLDVLKVTALLGLLNVDSYRQT